MLLYEVLCCCGKSAIMMSVCGKGSYLKAPSFTTFFFFIKDLKQLLYDVYQILFNTLKHLSFLSASNFILPKPHNKIR